MKQTATCDLCVCLCSSQVARLLKEVQKGEQDMGASTGQISMLKDAQEKLLEELDATRARQRESSNLSTALQVTVHGSFCRNHVCPSTIGAAQDHITSQQHLDCRGCWQH